MKGLFAHGFVRIGTVTADGIGIENGMGTESRSEPGPQSKAEPELKWRTGLGSKTSEETGSGTKDTMTLNSNNFTNMTASLISETNLLLSGIPIVASELATLITAAEEKAGILHNLTPAYKQKYVEAAEKHVAELHTKAKNYMRYCIFHS
ncbi:hypothetical protein EVAR_36105_1 [Eumeta japonica]|uniref:Uncharacterized protein n=1 Tax=Eumeta variegata TaxID=151549 RepID=A0A4C1X2S0_EUMVA|nr:hypothetical protein EVAR_36105_1 [Eumeta japonica]